MNTNWPPPVSPYRTSGKIIRIDTKGVRAAGRSTSGVKLLDLDQDDKVAAAMTIPPEDPKPPTPEGGLIQ